MPNCVYVALPHGWDLDKVRARYRQGIDPDESPYGFLLARDFGFDPIFSSDFGRRLPSPLQLLLIRVFLCDVVHAYRNRASIRRADIVWTMLETEGLAIALLMRLRIVPRRPVVMNVVWMFDRWDRMVAFRASFNRWVARWISRMTVHSDRSLPYAREAMPDAAVERLYFGVNEKTFSPDDPASRQRSSTTLNLVAIGSDDTRDWTTFLAAFGNDARFSLKLVCQWMAPDSVAGFDNCEVVVGPLIETFKKLYAEADYAVIPMRENLFSGITVALEAAAMGTPILCSRTGGVPTYFDESEACYVPVGDAAAMRDAALRTSRDERDALATRARTRFFRCDYTTRGMVGRYIEITGQLLGR